MNGPHHVTVHPGQSRAARETLQARCVFLNGSMSHVIHSTCADLYQVEHLRKDSDQCAVTNNYLYILIIYIVCAQCRGQKLANVPMLPVLEVINPLPHPIGDEILGRLTLPL
jgi:hypothetical protein